MAEHPVIKEVRVYPDIAGEYRFTCYSANGEAIVVSSEGYSGVEHCLEAAKALFPDAVFDTSALE